MEVVSGHSGERVGGHAADLGEQRGGVRDKSGLVAFAAVRLGREVRRIGFDQEPIRRHLGRVEKVMGALLVLTGIAFLTGAINDVGFWLLETFPALGRVG